VGRFILALDRHRPHAICAVSKMNDPRTKELGHLKLALATFALQLDVFEMVTQDVMLSIGKPGNHVPQADVDRNSRKDNPSGDQ
jgi:hypothetical protein